MKHKKRASIVFALALSITMGMMSYAHAAGDLSLHATNIWFSKTPPFHGETVRIYARVHNNGPDDVRGSVQIQIDGANIGNPQVISIVPGNPDDVFVDWTAIGGTHTIGASIYPQTNDGDIPANNSAQITMRVDYDTDRDNVGNADDIDDDNDGIRDTEEQVRGTNQYKKDTDDDGTNDANDAFPLNSAESQDTDKDGIGNTDDLDDDGDDLSDVDDPNDTNSGPRISVRKYNVVMTVAETKEKEAEEQKNSQDGSGDDENKDVFFIVGNPFVADTIGYGGTIAGYANTKGADLVATDLIQMTQGETMKLDASGSKDPDGNITEYAWTIQKTPTVTEMKKENIAAQKVSDKPYANIAFPHAGHYTIALVVTDNVGESREQKFQVEVQKPLNYWPYIWGIALALALVLLFLYTRSTHARRPSKILQRR